MMAGLFLQSLRGSFNLRKTTINNGGVIGSSLAACSLLNDRFFSTSGVAHHSNKLWQEPDPEKRGIKLYDKESGKRGSYKDAELRFKRLDWGQYIHPRSGRNKKMFKRSLSSKWTQDQHVFIRPHHKRNLDFMMSPELKRKRYFPEDIYQKYNEETTYWKMRMLKHKNMENIKRYGNDVYKFDRFKAHRKYVSKYNVIPADLYEPPGYFQEVAGNEIYKPADNYPKVDVAPHFGRDPIQTKGPSKKLEKIRLSELYSGHKGPRLRPWSPIFYTTLWGGCKV